MTLVFNTPNVTTIPVIGGESFPVRRVYCVGRNYAAHAREMGGDPNREPPFFFMKPADAIVGGDATIPYPVKTKNYHHEIELVVALSGGGRNVPLDQASGLIFGYGAGLDMTRRDLQDEAKELRRPWDMSKGFDQSGPCGPLSPVRSVGLLESGTIELRVNDKVRQRGDLRDMIWNVPEMISFLSELVELAPGDIIFSGTPDGVGAVVSGDRLHAHVDGLTDLHVTIA